MSCADRCRRRNRDIRSDRVDVPGSITPAWTNTGGDTVTPTLAYRGGTGDLFFITGDLDAYNTQLGDPNSAHGDQVVSTSTAPLLLLIPI